MCRCPRQRFCDERSLGLIIAGLMFRLCTALLSCFTAFSSTLRTQQSLMFLLGKALLTLCLENYGRDGKLDRFSAE